VEKSSIWLFNMMPARTMAAFRKEHPRWPSTGHIPEHSMAGREGSESLRTCALRHEL
jgi:hypothetical protein